MSLAFLSATQGEAPADLLILQARLVLPATEEIRVGGVAVAQGRIAAVGDVAAWQGKATTVVSAGGAYLLPGLVEPHAHPWLAADPGAWIEAWLPRGVTTVVGDTLPWQLVAGKAGVHGLVAAFRQAPLRYRWLLRLGDQSGGPLFPPQDVQNLLHLPEVAGIAEYPHWARLLREPALWVWPQRARAAGKIFDGHAAGASVRRLRALRALGVTSCHESVTAEEAQARLELGMWVGIRHSSLRPDLPGLLPFVRRLPAGSRVWFTTDGASPAHVEEEGALDTVLARLVEGGIPPARAVRWLTLHAAEKSGLDHLVGDLQPGLSADMVLSESLSPLRPRAVWVAGRQVVAEGALLVPPSSPPTLPPLTFPPPQVLAQRVRRALDHARSAPPLHLAQAAITRTGAEGGHTPLLCALLHTAWARATVARLTGAGDLSALATTFTSASGLLVLGRDEEAVVDAALAVARHGGGIAWRQDDGLHVWPLPQGGFMSLAGWRPTVAEHRRFLAHVRSRGYRHTDPLYTLLFLTADFLPDVRLLPGGLTSVKDGRILWPPVSLA